MAIWRIIAMLQMAYASLLSVYSSDFSTVYVQSNNGSLYQLQIPANAQNAQQIESGLQEIAAAPANSSLVVSKSGLLYAVWGTSGCYSSPIQISQYNSRQDVWVTIAQSGSSQKWYLDKQSVWLDRSDDSIYIFGGSCSGATQSGFYRYSLTNQTFERMSSSNGIKPHEMAGAAAIPLNNYETLLIGGRASSDAWISMQQIAIWGQNSWSFDLVGNSSMIDSREDPLLLPIWSRGANGASTSLSQILVIGGTVAGRDAVPSIVALNNSPTQGWYWTVPTFDTSDFASSDMLFSLYSTIANGDPNTGALTLYGRAAQSDVWSPVQHLTLSQSNTISGTSVSGEHKSNNTAVIAIVSTLLPIIVIVLLSAAAWWLWRRRREHMLFKKSAGQRRFTVESFETPPNPFSDDYGGSHSWSRHSFDQMTEDKGSILLTDDGHQMIMSKKRSLRVVNPDDQ